MTSTSILLENGKKEAETPIVAPVKDGVSLLFGLFFILGCVAAWTGVFWLINFLSNKLLG
jgi:hypothetical protein